MFDRIEICSIKKNIGKLINRKPGGPFMRGQLSPARISSRCGDFLEKKSQSRHNNGKFFELINCATL